ncbi:hypothetical protein [Rothia sp. P5766]|uniref:hypothetical protein n=1 Tax=unclassified Rothia (in: high G+C Gram-positive bacteria) TaxID=2689056 RepID=UPI003ADF2794
MTDTLKFRYEDLQSVIDIFEKTRANFETLASSACEHSASQDPVAEHHAGVVRGQDGKLLASAMEAFTNARDGAQEAYRSFKAADAGGK